MSSHNAAHPLLYSLKRTRKIRRLRTRAVAELRPFVHHPIIKRRATQPQSERAGRGGFGPAGIGRCVLRRIPPHHTKPAGRGEREQNARNTCGHKVRDIIEPGRRPAKRTPARFDVPDHAVGGVQRLVGEEAGKPTHEQPERRGHDRVVEAFSEAFRWQPPTLPAR